MNCNINYFIEICGGGCWCHSINNFFFSIHFRWMHLKYEWKPDDINFNRKIIEATFRSFHPISSIKCIVQWMWFTIQSRKRKEKKIITTMDGKNYSFLILKRLTINFIFGDHFLNSMHVCVYVHRPSNRIKKEKNKKEVQNVFWTKRKRTKNKN